MSLFPPPQTIKAEVFARVPEKFAQERADVVGRL